MCEADSDSEWPPGIAYIIAKWTCSGILIGSSPDVFFQGQVLFWQCFLFGEWAWRHGASICMTCHQGCLIFQYLYFPLSPLSCGGT